MTTRTMQQFAQFAAITLGLIAAAVAPLMLSTAHAQSNEFVLQALACRGEQSNAPALLAVGGISQNEIRALGIGTSPSNDWCLFLSSRVKNDHSHVQGLNPAFGQCLTRFFKAAPGRLSILSGYRDPYHQARLFNAELAENGGDVAASRRDVAPPPCNDRSGNRIQYDNSNQFCANGSMHNYGLAADLRFNGVPCGGSQVLCDWAHANAGAFGLTFRLGHEPWHVEPIRGGNCEVTGVQYGVAEGQDEVASYEVNPTPRPLEAGGVGTQFLEDIGVRDPEDPNTPRQNILSGLFGSVFGGQDYGQEEGQAGSEEDANENESLGYSFGQLVGSWFGNLFSGAGQQEPTDEQPAVETIYYYETTTGTTTVYTVLSAERDVLATSSVSVSEAIEAATVDLTSYLVLRIDGPDAVPERGVGEVTPRPTPDWNFSGTQQPGSGNTFTGSFGNANDALGGTAQGNPFAGSTTFGANTGDERPFLRTVVDVIRNFFSGMFGLAQ